MAIRGQLKGEFKGRSVTIVYGQSQPSNATPAMHNTAMGPGNTEATVKSAVESTPDAGEENVDEDWVSVPRPCARRWMPKEWHAVLILVVTAAAGTFAALLVSCWIRNIPMSIVVSVLPIGNMICIAASLSWLTSYAATSFVACRYRQDAEGFRGSVNSIHYTVAIAVFYGMFLVAHGSEDRVYSMYSYESAPDSASIAMVALWTTLVVSPLMGLVAYWIMGKRFREADLDYRKLIGERDKH